MLFWLVTSSVWLIVCSLSVLIARKHLRFLREEKASLAEAKAAAEYAYKMATKATADMVTAEARSMELKNTIKDERATLQTLRDLIHSETGVYAYGGLVTYREKVSSACKEADASLRELRKKVSATEENSKEAVALLSSLLDAVEQLKNERELLGQQIIAYRNVRDAAVDTVTKLGQSLSVQGTNTDTGLEGR